MAFGLAGRRPEQVLSILAIESEPASPAWAAKMDRLLDEQGIDPASISARVNGSA